MFCPLLANVVLLVLMSEISEGGVPASCTPFVGYLQRDGRWEGVLAVTAPESFVPGEDFTVQVSMAVSEKQEDFQAALELSESTAEVEAKLRAGERFLYRVRFPVPDSAPLPRVTAVTANGVKVCEAESDFGPRTPSLQVTHTLKSSASEVPNTTQAPTGDTDFGSNTASPKTTEIPINVSTMAKENNSHAQIPMIESCGRRLYNESTQCMGVLAPITDLTQWPWLAALITVAETPSVIIYSGTLITKKHVLTAARKFTLDTQGVLLSADKMLAIFGVRHLHGAKLGEERFLTQERKVQTIIIHPDYDYSQRAASNDIAIMLLESPVLATPFVRPACLWSDPSPPVPGTVGYVAGWDYFTGYAKSFDAAVGNWDGCINEPGIYLGATTDKLTFCAANKQGFGLCIAGMGAGFYVPEFTAAGGTRWLLAGSINFINKGDKPELCDNKKSFFLNDLSKHMPWIQSIINQ